VLASLEGGVLERAVLDAADAAGIGVTVTFIDTLPCRNVFVSETAARIMGTSVDELLAIDPMRLIAPEHRPHASERLDRRMRGEPGRTTYELNILRKDGTSATIDVSATRTTIGGRPAVFAFLVDASHRREAERQRLRNEARFRELIERAPEPIGIIRGGRFVYANRAYLDVLGYRRAEDLYATPIGQMLDEQDSSLRDARELRLVSRGEPVPPHVYRVRRPDGSIVLLEVSSVAFEYEGKPSVLTVARDVTARKRLEAQLVQADRLAALGTLAAGVAHEINNPLAYVMLNLEWIARKLPAVRSDPASLDALMELLKEARDGAERVAAIVRELRSFSRADGESRRLVDLAAVVQSAIKIAGHEIRHRARVVTSFEPARPVWGNEARLEQVVINLLLNASQAMPEPPAENNEIRISVAPHGPGHVVLEVSDNGRGIPADVLPRIFDPFFTTKPPGVGTGLGLSICHGIVTALGGQISAYSDPGEGTTLRVVLPTVEPSANEPAGAASEGPSSRRGRRARVLVVDDEPPIANALCELLAPEHDVVAATSGRDALAALRATPELDVLFCDLLMPGMSGVDLYRAIRAERPGLERRIVFMTGGPLTPHAAELLASVDNRRLEKPFDLALVERIVREMTQEAAAAAAAADGAR
jgi:PAS domain S-box-containing protein